MRLSTLFGRTLREAPADAEHVAFRLVLRAGLVRPLQAGSFALLPLGMRVLRRIESLMHEELGRIGAQELRTPVIQSVSAWEQTGRSAAYGPSVLRITDRSDRALIFAPTHEEAVAELARREIASYRQMPALVYQIHTKYRDEPRARGGLMRMREFTMLDAYSLDADDAGLDAAYRAVGAAFERILKRCGIEFVAAEAGGGEMGGSETIEYHALSEAGEDTLVRCLACGYSANAEVASTRPAVRGGETTGAPADSLPTELVETPNCATIAEVAAFLGIPESATAKAVFFDTPERGLVFAVIRGDRNVSEARLCAAAGVSALAPASAEQISAAGAVPGYASPVGLRVAGPDQHADAGVVVIADRSVVDAGPLAAGANRAGYHLRNVVYGRDWNATLVADIAAAQVGDQCPRCGGEITLVTGIELGHIFQLGTRFAAALGAGFLDQQGVERPVVMGSYGIGLERLLQAIVEQHHDEAGIIWPAAVAPFDLHLIRLGKGDAIRAAADALYDELRAEGLSVLYDDREETAGVKFNDADLIGLPIRALVSERLLAEGMIELKPRGGEARKVAHSQFLAEIGSIR